MRYLAILFSLLVPAVVMSAPTGPSVAVDDASYDFGTVPEGARVQHTFLITNEGKSELQIQRTIPSCGCTVSKADPDHIVPGQQGKILVDFNSTGFSGRQLKKIQVLTNDPETPTLYLTLSGTIEEELTIKPTRIQFDGVRQGEAAYADLEVQLKEGTEHTIGDVRSFSPFIKISEAARSERHWKGKVELTAATPRGEMRERIIVTIGSRRKPKTVNVPVYGFVEGDVSISPAAISFGMITPKATAQGGSLERAVKIENATSGKLEIEKITTNSSVLSYKLVPIEPGKRYVLKISVLPRPAGSEDMLKGLLTIVTNKGEYSVNVFGAYPPR